MSTLSPTDSAVVGSTAACITRSMCSVSVQNFSSPNVSNLKICFPLAISCGDGGGSTGLRSLLHPTTDTTDPIIRKSSIHDWNRSRALRRPFSSAHSIHDPDNMPRLLFGSDRFPARLAEGLPNADL